VKNKPKKVLELCSGPGLFAQAMDEEMVQEVELVDSSGTSVCTGIACLI
jgi:ubiquinone/menaquinone biosynthesis C-methylase UbiE